MNWDVIVVGGGAAGLVAAERSAHRGRRTLLLEKNRRLGVKILMSGGTRCNLTQATDSRGIVAAYGPPGRFLHSALAALGPHELVALVEAEGTPTKVESTGKVFPASDRAADVLAAFVRRLERSGAETAFERPVVDVSRAETGFLVHAGGEPLHCASLVITTGGRSYPGSGTTGDAYAWAAALGHTVVPPRPALTPLVTEAAWVRELQGVTMPDVAVRLVERPAQSRTAMDAERATKEVVIDQRRGSLLFAHFGLSGPVALDVSRFVSAHARPRLLALVCDFLPATRTGELDDQLKRTCAERGRSSIASIVSEWLPTRLAAALLNAAGAAPDTRGAEFSKAERARLVAAIKSQPIPLSGVRGFQKAEVTAGGVSLAEVDSRTMESRLVPGLYWAGEVLDLDGPIGGYNFQAAFSTGWLAGFNA